MSEKLLSLVGKLKATHSLSLAEYQKLIEGYTPEFAELFAKEANEVRAAVYGNEIFVRGLIEISSYCKNNCLYCGLRRGNEQAERYRLTGEEILSCAREGYALGFRTFVLQGGEDAWFTDERLCAIVRQIKSEFPDCAVTLSLGERSFESYRALYARAPTVTCCATKRPTRGIIPPCTPPNCALKTGCGA